MATTKRTSDITVALYEWNKLTTRNIAEDEKEYFNGGIEFVWEGKTPEIDEEVLVYNPKTQIYTLISGSIMEKELVLDELPSTTKWRSDKKRENAQDRRFCVRITSRKTCSRYSKSNYRRR